MKLFHFLQFIHIGITFSKIFQFIYNCTCIDLLRVTRPFDLFTQRGRCIRTVYRCYGMTRKQFLNPDSTHNASDVPCEKYGLPGGLRWNKPLYIPNRHAHQIFKTFAAKGGSSLIEPCITSHSNVGILSFLQKRGGQVAFYEIFSFSSDLVTCQYKFIYEIVI